MLNHPRRRVVVALAVLAMSMGMGFIPTLLAQRVTRKQQGEPLRILTLSGKVGTPRRANLRTGSPPRPLSVGQRFTLFKGKVLTYSFILTPGNLAITGKGNISSYGAYYVVTYESGEYIYFEGTSNASNPEQLQLSIKAKSGRLYAIDFSVRGDGSGPFTLTNSVNPGSTHTIPIEGSDGQHITAYATADQDGWLIFDLTCSGAWKFWSVGVSEL